jgi:phage tail tape-measure protein
VRAATVAVRCPVTYPQAWIVPQGATKRQNEARNADLRKRGITSRSFRAAASRVLAPAGFGGGEQLSGGRQAARKAGAVFQTLVAAASRA